LDDERRLGLSKGVYKSDSLLLITAVIWGSAFVAQRVGMSYVGPLTFNGVRFALGTLVLLPFARKGEDRPAAGESANPLSLLLFGGILAGMLLFLGAALQQVGLVYTTAGKAGFITGLYVIIVPLMGLFLGHWPGWGGWAGACMATLGLYLLSVTEAWRFAPGDLWELFGAFFWAGHVLTLGWLSPKLDRLKLACIQYAVCSLLSLIGACFTETMSVDGIYGAIGPILYGGILSVGIAYTLQVVAQRYAPPTHAAIILSLEAVFAALAGWLILGETLTLRALTGCALMFSGMLSALLWS